MRKQKKFELMAIMEEFKKVNIPENDTFYTRDTEAFLIFITEPNYEFDSATIALLNRDDGSLISVDQNPVVEGVTEYEMPVDVIAHYGKWNAQVIYHKGQEDYTSPLVSFSVERFLADSRPPRLTEVESIAKLRKEAKELIEVLEGMTYDNESLVNVLQAKDGELTLNARLERDNDNLTQAIETKADKSVVDQKFSTMMSQTEFDSWVATLLDGGPSIFMDSLAQLQSTYPDGAVGVALVRETDPAKIYVWDGNAWEDFGDYQGLEVGERTITPNKTTFITGGKNKFDISTAKVGYSLSSSGQETLSENNTISNYITVKNEPIWFSYNLANTRLTLPTIRVVTYDSSGEILEVLSNFASGDTITNPLAKTFRVAASNTIANSEFQIEYGESATAYEPFSTVIDDSVKVKFGNIIDYEPPETVIEDGAITETKLADQVVSPRKTTYLNVGKNKFDINAVKEGYLLASNGSETPSNDNVITDYIPVSTGDSVTLTSNGIEIASNRLVFYDNNYNLLQVVSGVPSGYTLTTDNVAYFRTAPTKSVAQTLQIEINSSPTAYEPYHYKLDTSVKVDHSNILNLSQRLAGKTMIAFGDSITQDAHERSHYPTYFEAMTGVRYINQGYGGTTMTRHTMEEFRPFSMTYLLEAKMSNDYTAQEAVITAWENGDSAEQLRAGNYRLQLDKWIAVDLNDVFAVTILMGANDHGAHVGNIDDLDPNGGTFIGAYNHVLKTLQENYPSMRIILITPIYREHDEGVEDRTLLFVQAVKDIGKKHNYPVYDAYHNLGFNQYNWGHYSTDGLHPIIAVGQPRMGEAISSYLNSVL